MYWQFLLVASICGLLDYLFVLSFPSKFLCYHFLLVLFLNKLYGSYTRPQNCMGITVHAGARKYLLVNHHVPSVLDRRWT